MKIIIQELGVLSSYCQIIEIKKCVTKTIKLIDNQELNKTTVGQVRSCLRLTLEGLLPHNPKNQSFFRSSMLCLFGCYHKPKRPAHLNKLSVTDYNKIEEALTGALYKLSVQFPTNEDDFIDLEPLPEMSLRFIGLHGAHYNLQSIAEHVRHNGFTIPDTNKPMLEYEKQLLETKCAEKGIALTSYNQEEHINNCL